MTIFAFDLALKSTPSLLGLANTIMSFQAVPQAIFPFTFGSTEEEFFELEKQKLRNVCVKAPAETEGERNFKWAG